MAPRGNRHASRARCVRPPLIVAIQGFRASLRRRNDAASALDSHTLDLQLCCAATPQAPEHVTCGEADRFIDGP